VNGTPLVRRVIGWLVTQGIDDLVLNLHHAPASIAAVVGDGGDLRARIRYSWENPVLGSAGGPRHALPLLVDTAGTGSSEPTFLLVNGDTLTDFPLRDMIAAHRSSGALVTMALIHNPRPDAYGGVLVERGRVVGFTRRGAMRETFHFIGVQVAEQRAFADLDDGVPAESVASLYPRLMQAGTGAIAAHVVDAPFSDIGTPSDYLETSLAFAAAEGDHLTSREGVSIDSSAQVTRTAVWRNVSIGAHAELADCIVCDGSTIPDGARFERCAIVRAEGRQAADGEYVDGDLLIRPF
jgi:mannose-1-phosphate guanylyltransferase